MSVVIWLVAGLTALSWGAWLRLAMGWSTVADATTQTGAPDLVDEARDHAPGPVDVGFVQDMSLHHEQALAMARLALTRGSMRVQALAQGILNQQLRELGLMQGWLMVWQAPPTSGRDDMAWMRQAYDRSPRRDPAYDQVIEGCLRGAGMPGLATAAQIEALAQAPDALAFDQGFVSLMVRHHQGAVVMARFASEHAGLALVRDFARSVAAEQLQEVGQMTAWWQVAQRP